MFIFRNILVILLFTNFSFAAEKNPAMPLTEKELFKKMIKFYENVNDFSASFNQEATQKQPKRLFTKSGNVFFKKPLFMRWDYKEPEEVYYISDGNLFYCYQVEDSIVYRIKIPDSELYTSLQFLISPSKIEEDFKVTENTKNQDGLVQFILEPKKTSGSYKQIILFIEKETAKIKRTTIVDPLGNESSITFEKESFKELPADGFKFIPPKGVRVEDLF